MTNDKGCGDKKNAAEESFFRAQCNEKINSLQFAAGFFAPRWMRPHDYKQIFSGILFVAQDFPRRQVLGRSSGIFLADKSLPMIPVNPALPGLCELPSNQSVETDFAPQVVLIYEDLDVGLRAVKLLGAITRAASVEDTQLTTWRFDHLESDAAQKLASVRAQTADIVIVAMRSNHGLPNHIRSWFDDWIRCRRSPEGALVGVFEPGDSMEFRPSGTASLLQAAAITAGMDYFSNATPTSSGNRFSENQAPNLGAERPSSPRWGLNE